MPVSFPQTMRSLRVDRSRGSLVGFALIFALLAGWSAWLLQGRVAVYSISTAARLEAEGAIHPIQSLYTGRIAANHLVIGRKVAAGDVLLELDANIQRLQLAEEEVQSHSIRNEVETLRNEIEAESRAMQEEEQAAGIGIEETQARLREAEAAAAYAETEQKRYAQLEAAGLSSQADLARATLEAQKQRTAVEGLSLAIGRQQKEQAARASERRSRIEALQRQMSQLAGLKAKMGAVIDRLESEVELRQVIAPVSGTVGEAANLKIGAVVSAGERLGAIVPGGSLKIVAQFHPAEALGRIHPGQRARLRLDGFPWTQYGALSATVTRIAHEVRDGLVRVELKPAAGFQLALQHGLPGAAEVEVERISPAALLLRIAGQALTPKPTGPEAKPQAVASLKDDAR
jgi:membrane fusion protein (multidrug efflux system)